MALKAYILSSPAVLGLGQISRGGLPDDYPPRHLRAGLDTGHVSRPVYSPQTRDARASEDLRGPTPNPAAAERCEGKDVR
jgi:hypothetical protein